MCGPAVIPILAAAAAVVTAGGQVYGGLAAKAQGTYEQRVANQNAQLELRSRDDAIARGEVAQMRHWRQVAQSVGDQRARQAASGLDPFFGSPSDLINDAMLIGYEDSSTIAHNTLKEVQGYEINSANYVMQGRAARSRGNTALVASGISAFSTLLGGAKQIAGMQGATATAGAGG